MSKYHYDNYIEYTDRGTRYALDVVNGKIIAGKKVIKACQRHLKNLKQQESDDFNYVYLPDKADVAVRFMEMLPDISTGKPVPLADFQAFIVFSLYGWYRKDNHELRRFNKALISMARKNGKSALISSMAIYELLAGKYPELNRQVYCTAQNREQAHIVFDYVSQRLDGLLSKSKAIRNQTKKVRNEIKNLSDYSILKPLSRDTTNLNGLAPTLSILDEYGGAKTNEMLEVMESGAMLQPNLLTIIISTAYFDLNAPMYSIEYKHCEKILNEEVEQENYFVLIYELDKEKEIYDESKWEKANPLLSVDSIHDTLMTNLRNRVDEKVQQNDLLGLIVKTFNMWKQGSNESFIPSKEWEANAVDPNTINIQGSDAYIGLDLSRVADITALNFIIPLSDEQFYTFSHSFVSNVVDINQKAQQDKIDYPLFIDNGYMTLSDTASGFISYTQVINKLFEIVNKYDLNVVSIQYDEWGADKFLLEYEQLAKDTKFADIPFINVPQNYKSLSPVIKEFQMKVYERNIKHDNSPLTNIAINNAVVRYDNNRNILIDKSKQRNKIDNLIAMIISFAEARFHEYKDNNKITEDYIMSSDFSF